jgi:N-acetylglutamate synthase-like GNAT family acetyltransferase
MAIAIATSVRRATPSDAAALATLVNRAYEVEAFFVEGDRTDEREVGRLIDEFVVLDRDGGLAAAVHVTAGDRQRGGFIRMLSVSPDLQGMGLGTRLVRVAEAMCAAMGCDEVSLHVINLREELSRWYRGLGYREVGTLPYVNRPIKQACHFVEMRRRIA